MFKVLLLAALSLFSLVRVHAESHTVAMHNKCGYGTPLLIQNGKILSTGEDYTSDGPFESAIAFLQTGSCGPNGEGCTLVEVTLVNPTSPGGGSCSDISLIPPHSFSVASSFWYYGGCHGTGLDCWSPTWGGAFTDSTNGAISCCEDDNVNLSIDFC